MAIGVFFAFVIPLAQAPAAGVTALFLRSNLPVALASTLVSNPLTYAPIYYAAYRVGNALLYSGYDFFGRTAFLNLSKTF